MFKDVIRIILFIVFCLIASNPAKATEVDTFQQVMNYLTTGDPFKKKKRGPFYVYEIKVFDRKKCIAGWEDDVGGYLKYHWNNVDVELIKIQDKFIPNLWMKYLVLSGHPFVIDFKPNNSSLKVMLSLRGLQPGKYSRISIPLGKTERYDNERLVKALQLLYSRHCSGAQRKSAF